ncbi:hypothetical protein SASPL_115668 [Salvia splendens]|uniref:Protein MIZU-KUSSEI 1 n=2 Tax=Salvia splendens TaxID=180675 RepID=A0A8X8Y2Y8_SALSN|nr:hypothetical protein SASPL_115668 [Salvia splendens]
MAKTPQDSSFSFSRRYFHWKNKDDEMQEILNFTSKSEDLKTFPNSTRARKKISVLAISKLRAALALGRDRSPFSSGRVVGTLFGQRRGHVRFAFQEDFKAAPAFLVELATPTSALVKEMASGLVRVALECEKRAEKKGAKLLEEPVWRTYCNGKKCGYAMRRECGPEEWKVLNAVGPISMGAGVIPGDGEMMYMRAKFERVVGSKDSEAFYMMNPDGNGGPELSIYLLRV